MLAYPDISKGYIFRADASKKCISAVLSQIDCKGNERIVNGASRTLKNSEINYTTTEKELLAIVWELFKFEIYLRGAEIKVMTDHQALIFTLTTRFTNERLNRWIMAIQNFDIKIEHIKGKENIEADLFSRNPEIYPNSRKKPEEVIISALQKIEISEELRKIIKNLEESQDKQDNLQEIKRKIEREDKNEEKCKHKLVNKLLCKLDNSGNYKVMIPETLIDTFIREIHNVYGHIGTLKSKKLIEENFYVNKIKHRISKNIAGCETCQKSKIWNRTCRASMKNIILNGKNQLLSVDFYGPLPTSTGGTKFIFLAIDAFTKHVKLYPIKKANTKIILKQLFEEYIPECGKPEQLICDHGSQFISKK